MLQMYELGGKLLNSWACVSIGAKRVTGLRLNEGQGKSVESRRDCSISL